MSSNARRLALAAAFPLASADLSIAATELAQAEEAATQGNLMLALGITAETERRIEQALALVKAIRAYRDY